VFPGLVADVGDQAAGGVVAVRAAGVDEGALEAIRSGCLVLEEGTVHGAGDGGSGGHADGGAEQGHEDHGATRSPWVRVQLHTTS